ncbi:MAG: helix-turn-helix transcriptional regulator [Acidimicrobiia bacterium]|jgi:transcriptional regulator with XRE-family HTH domain|nr:helix-turn-helix transcriptional regulator [Acidimicrobiia bacterium]
MVGRAVEFPVWALVRDARRRAGFTQQQLADRAGTSQPAIARYERAQAMPSLATLQRIAAACGLELRLRLDEPDGQRQVALAANLARSVEDRLRSVQSITELRSVVRRE